MWFSVVWLSLSCLLFWVMVGCFFCMEVGGLFV